MALRRTFLSSIFCLLSATEVLAASADISQRNTPFNIGPLSHSLSLVAQDSTAASVPALSEAFSTAALSTSDRLAYDAMIQMNQQYAATVIIPTYRALETQTQALSQQSGIFWENPTEANLSTLKSAWQKVADTWAKSGAFAFGPVHSLGYSVALESPTDTAGIEQLLATAMVPNVQSMPTIADLEQASLHPSLKGLGAISYLIGSKTFDEFSAQERFYLYYLSMSAYEAASGLRTAWQEGWDSHAPYQQALVTAGEPDNVFYLSPQAASEEIIRSLINSLTVITGEMLPEQLTTLPTPAKIEGLQQVASSVAGLKQAYLGRSMSAQTLRQTVTPEVIAGVSSLVVVTHPDTHPIIQQALELAINHLDQAIAEPTNTEAIAIALSALTTVQEQLETRVLPLVVAQTTQS